MSHYNRIDLGGRPLHSIHIGGIFASNSPSVVRTVLGSCIAVCLYEPVTRVGGMNHFMLPAGGSDLTVNARYGIHSMELLINECMKSGGDRRLFTAKVFGGGHVLRIRETDGNVPQINIKFALEFLKTENIPIVKQDLGGYSAREVCFYTDSGKVLMRRQTKDEQAGKEAIEKLNREERRSFIAPAVPIEADDNITLF
jgi:chemotaxis receptor (MCP) glutamine deamidase CheD